jgi:hypothetical protein
MRDVFVTIALYLFLCNTMTGNYLVAARAIYAPEDCIRVTISGCV